MSEKRNLWLWLPALVWMSVIFGVSSLPASSDLSATSGFDLEPLMPIAHIVEYAVLSALYLIALKGTTQLSRPQLFLISTVLATFYGISDEIHQMYVPNRTSSISDMQMDFIGAICGAILLSVMIVVRSTRKPAT